LIFFGSPGRARTCNLAVNSRSGFHGITLAISYLRPQKFGVAVQFDDLASHGNRHERSRADQGLPLLRRADEVSRADHCRIQILRLDTPLQGCHRFQYRTEFLRTTGRSTTIGAGRICGSGRASLRYLPGCPCSRSRATGYRATRESWHDRYWMGCIMSTVWRSSQRDPAEIFADDRSFGGPFGTN